MTAWDACTSEPWPLLRWIECHPALGAYLTLGAIIAAIWTTTVTLSAERRRIEARGRVIAFRLLPILQAIHADVQRCLKTVEELEPGTNDFSRIANSIGWLTVPTKIPDDIFRDTWAMPSVVALFVARLESSLAKYEIVANQPSLSSIGVIAPEERAKILSGIGNMLREIETLCGVVAKHCSAIERSTMNLRD